MIIKNLFEQEFEAEYATENYAIVKNHNDYDIYEKAVFGWEGSFNCKTFSIALTTVVMLESGKFSRHEIMKNISTLESNRGTGYFFAHSSDDFREFVDAYNEVCPECPITIEAAIAGKLSGFEPISLNDDLYILEYVG